MNINIIGWYGANNVGDDAFQHVFQQELGAHHALSFTRGVELGSDCTIVGGGGVTIGSYLDGLELHQGKRFAIGVDIGLHGPWWDRLTTLNFSEIVVRSKEYCWLAQDKGIKISYAPDIAFGLQHNVQKKLWMRTVGIVLTQDLDGRCGEQQCLAEAVRHLMERGYSIKFLAMHNGQRLYDAAFNILLAARVGIKYADINLTVLETPQQALEEISKLDFLYTMRFHGAIFATMVGVPFVALGNPGKCSLFCEQEQIHDSYLPFEHLNPYKLLAPFEQDQVAKSKKLLGIANSNKQQVQALFQRVRAEWLSP